jgi:hypothetical protein
MNFIIRLLGLTPVANADKWYRKQTTWLSLLQGALGAGVAAYIALPARMTDQWPDWLISSFGYSTVAVAIATWVAANVRQDKIAAPPVVHEPLQRLPEE